MKKSEHKLMTIVAMTTILTEYKAGIHNTHYKACALCINAGKVNAFAGSCIICPMYAFTREYNHLPDVIGCVKRACQPVPQSGVSCRVVEKITKEQGYTLEQVTNAVIAFYEAAIVLAENSHNLYPITPSGNLTSFAKKLVAIDKKIAKQYKIKVYENS